MSDSATWPERYAATALGWETTPDELVASTCGRLKPGRALVLCAGEGRNALWLAGRGWTVTAVEPSQVRVGRMLSHAALSGLSVDGLTADLLAYRPQSGVHDLVLLSYVHEPNATLRRILAAAVPGLRIGGRVVVIAHDASNLDEGYGGPGDPDRLVTAEAVSRRLQDLGLDVLRAEVLRREVVVEVGVRPVLDHVVEAVRPQEPDA